MIFLAVNSAAKCYCHKHQPITCLVTFCLALNAWSITLSRHFLSVINTKFLEYTWCVVLINKMSMLSRSVCFDGLSGQTERKNMLILLLGTTRTHRISIMTIAMITGRKYRDQVTDQELLPQNVTKHVMVRPTV